MQSKNISSSYLTLAYVFALALLGTAVTLAHVGFRAILENHEEVARLVNISGRQRMLSQRMAWQAQRYARSLQPPSGEKGQSELKKATDQFEMAHRELAKHAQLYPEVEAVFESHELHDKVANFISHAKQAEMPTLTVEERIEAIENLTQRADGLLVGLNELVKSYERMVDPGRLGRWEFLFWVGTLALLLAEALLIFRPLVHRLYDYHQQLEEQTAELRQANKKLRQFTYVASHDLQEPVRMVASYVDLLEQKYGEAFDADAQKFMRYAIEGAERMKHLIHDLLAYARLGRNTEPKQMVDLNKVLSHVKKNLTTALSESDGRVEADTLPTLMSHETQMTQLFQNLLSNAIKFCRNGVPPVVQIRCAPEKEDWVFHVSDNGIGFEAQYAKKIFEPFQRLHSRQAYQGTGIGLSIVDAIIQGHGGALSVASTPGKGTRFTFTLPQDHPIVTAI